MDSAQTTEKLRIDEPGPGARWGALVIGIIIAAIPTFVLSRLWPSNVKHIIPILLLAGFSLLFYGAAFFLFWRAMLKDIIEINPRQRTITTGIRTLFSPFTRYKTYQAENVADLVIKPGEKSLFVVNVLLKDGRQDLLKVFPSRAEAQAFTEKTASILWPEEASRSAAMDVADAGGADSRNSNNLVIDESGFIAGLVGSVFIAVISLLFLLVGYFHGVLEFTIIPAGVFGFLILVIFPKIFQKRVVLFDARKKTITISERSLLHFSGRTETYRWDEIKDILSEEVDMGNSVVYGVFLILPKLQPMTLVKYYRKEQEAEEMRIRIAALLRRELESSNGT